MKILKFGGTSLGSAERIKKAATLIDEEHKSVVVLSAMGGITNALVDLYGHLMNGRSSQALESISGLKNHFSETAYQLFDKKDFLMKALNEVDAQFEYIKANNSQLNLNEILAYGEKITSWLFSLYLDSIDRENTLLNAFDFMRTDENAEPNLEESTQLLNSLLESDRNKLFITQGFICLDHKGRVSNLKRGGSDYTATLIGAMLMADSVCIWTDIDGLHNNDPRHVEKTKAIHHLHFEEAAELAYFGAKILHPSSIRPARDRNIPVLLKNTMDPEAHGTVISSERKVEGIKAIAAKDGIQIIRIQSGRMLMAHGFMKKIFHVFDRFKVPVDVITTSEVAVSITIEDEHMIQTLVEELEKLGEVQVIPACSIISAVGCDISLNPSVLHPLFNCLSKIQPRMISLGGSRNNISIVLDTEQKEEALNRLHQSIFKTEPRERMA